MYAYALCAYAPLTPQEYLIKEVSSDLLLCIPHSFIQQHTTTKHANTDHLVGIKEDTPLEKLLGIRVNHLSTITDIDAYCQQKKKDPQAVHLLQT